MVNLQVWHMVISRDFTATNDHIHVLVEPFESVSLACQIDLDLNLGVG